MPFSRRHLPHWIPDDAAIFVTWRLAGPGPFQADSGPFWLQDPRVAGMVADALLYGETVRHFYQIHAWAIMPNHVHVIFQPHAAMPAIMRWLKAEPAAWQTGFWAARGHRSGKMSRSITWSAPRRNSRI